MTTIHRTRNFYLTAQPGATRAQQLAVSGTLYATMSHQDNKITIDLKQSRVPDPETAIVEIVEAIEETLHQYYVDDREAEKTQLKARLAELEAEENDQKE